MASGFRVYTNIDRSAAELAEQFKSYPTGNVADCMNRLGAMSYEIRQFCRKGLKMSGVAITVNARSGDNLMIHKAANMAQEGDVIVIANGMERNRSLLGDILVKVCKSKGVAGIVVDGPIRDLEEIYRMDFPIYATGSTPGGPFKEGPGEVNVSISCGGICVQPGDIIYGDDDGVLVIPKEDAREILANVEVFSRQDAQKALEAEQGRAKREWVDILLEKKGCEII